jgi:O-antigen ligase
MFLLVNALLFIRPAEFTPALLGLPAYEATILGCWAISFPVVLGRSMWRVRADRPINTCVVALLPAILLSHLVNGQLGEAWPAVLDFAKVFLYYLLLVCVVDSADRLRGLLLWLAGCAALVTALAVLHYHRIVHVPAIEFVETALPAATGEGQLIRRLGSTGLFQDPNDLSLMLVISVVISTYGLLERRSWVWVAPLGLFVYALLLTRSRGGFLALLAGVLVLLLARHGRKAVRLGIVILPVLFGIFAGRQTDFTIRGSTGQTRIELWSEGMELFRAHPLFGIGSTMFDDRVGHVAHNSFIHAFAELGLLGGAPFLGMFSLALLGLFRLGAPRYPIVDPELRGLRPYVLTIVACYVVGLSTLSCCYTIPTYTVIGLAAVYLRLAGARLPWPVLPSGRGLLQHLGAASLGFVAVAHFYLRYIARFE